MSRDGKGAKYILAIDTNEYAGNFERQMFWYMTGLEPEYMCGGSDWIGPLAEKELGLDGDSTPDIVTSIIDKLDGAYRDDTGAQRPVEIVPSPGRQGHYNSVGIMFAEKLTDGELKHLKSRAKLFPTIKAPPVPKNHPVGDYLDKDFKNVKIKGFRLLDYSAGPKIKKV